MVTISIEKPPALLVYSWEFPGDVYVPVMTGEPPAPRKLIELGICSCKNKCITYRWRSNKYDWQRNVNSSEELGYIFGDDDDGESYLRKH